MENVICLIAGMLLGMPISVMMLAFMADRRPKEPPTKEEWKVMSMYE